MRPVEGLLVLVLTLAAAFAVDESCVGRCNNFNPRMKCQCDSMCVYYESCCVDFSTACPKKMARGDTFDESEDDLIATTIDPPSNTTTVAPTTLAHITTTNQAPTLPPDPDAVPCSGRSFDAFLQLKNGSIFAFRGDYFFELDERAVVPGYPKLIKDVWGISGPIDAAFTRINCQGKAYIFKGNKYWRFEGDVLDEDYPRDISVGFEKIPDNVDAAFAIPAPGHHAKEKVYFFKGDQYYQYEFKHQPSHEECVSMTRSSPSVLFTHYTDLYSHCDLTWDNLFMQLFQGLEGHHKGPHFISKDWVGLRGPVDAAMVGRLYVSPKPSPSTSDPPSVRRRQGRRRGARRRKNKRGRHSRSLHQDLLSIFDGVELEYGYHYEDYGNYDTTINEKSMPVQNVYFFKKDKYYRVDLQTRRIDFANPPYPRSIAKYWLGCKSDSLAEK